MDRSPNPGFLLRVVSGEFLFEAINPVFETSTGLTGTRVVGRTPHDVLPQIIAADIVEQCRHCLSAAPPAPFICVMPLPAGRTSWEFSLTPLLDESGAVVCIFGSARDVRENAGLWSEDPQGLDPEADRQPNVRFTALPDGRVEWADPTLLAMAGLSSGAPIATVVGLVRPEDLARLTPPPDGGQADAAYETDVRLRGRGGRYRWFRVRAELIDGLAGRRWYGVAIDIEARKSREILGVKAPASRANVLAGFAGCSLTIDRTWRTMSLTPEAAAWIGMGAEQLLGVDCRERLPIPEALIKAVSASIAAQATLQIEIPTPNHPGKWMAFQIHPFAAGASIVFWDITEQRRTDQVAHVIVEPVRSLLDTSTSEMAILDSDGMIVSVNAAWRTRLEEFQIGGATQSVGLSYREICKAEIPDFDETALKTGMSEVIAGRQTGYEQPYVIDTPRGLSWRRLRLVPFRLEPSVQLLAIHENITDVRQARAALRNTSEQLLSALAHERKRIAFELHDSTSQHLAAVGLGLIRLKRLVGEGAGDLIEDMAKSVQEAVREIRVLSYLMKPSGLERDGLESAARLFVSGFGARTGLIAEFRTEGGFETVAEPVQNAVFRVLQEALSNIYRHAKASRVEIDLTNRGGALNVRIADDGRGIAQEGNGRLTVSPGVGFASMEARVAQLGGTLNISRGAVGTIVEASIPVADTHV